MGRPPATDVSALSGTEASAGGVRPRTELHLRRPLRTVRRDGGGVRTHGADAHSRRVRHASRRPSCWGVAGASSSPRAPGSRLPRRRPRRPRRGVDHRSLDQFPAIGVALPLRRRRQRARRPWIHPASVDSSDERARRGVLRPPPGTASVPVRRGIPTQRCGDGRPPCVRPAARLAGLCAPPALPGGDGALRHLSPLRLAGGSGGSGAHPRPPVREAPDVDRRDRHSRHPAVDRGPLGRGRGHRLLRMGSGCGCHGAGVRTHAPTVRGRRHRGCTPSRKRCPQRRTNRAVAHRPRRSPLLRAQGRGSAPSADDRGVPSRTRDGDRPNHHGQSTDGVDRRGTRS